ncbi:hypothetical protein B484DRAFT_446579 [Ochromonadaceae sp. CCMP2298]|nr:hypothetical protein B484DRAFT_446579 [Ochromonadaceae sp. CCMP2298]
MGCCASTSGEDDVLLSNETSAAVTCRAGLKGENVTVTEAAEGGSYAVKGSGTLLGSCCLDCDTGMWEVKVGKNPEGVRIGIKKHNAKTNPGKLFEHLDSDADARSPAWFLDETELKEGDVVGIYWDQTDLPMLTFSVNGEPARFSVTRIRPAVDIYPAVSVREGSSCDIILDGTRFLFPPKSSKFKMIICSSSLI